MAQEGFDRNDPSRQSELEHAQADDRSGIFRKAGAAHGGWGFVVIRADGTFEIAPAIDGGIIGSSEGAQVRVQGPGVASEHARIEVRADGVYLDDMGSEGGTYVGGVRARRIGVAHGDVVRFGETLAVFVERGLADYQGSVDPAATLVASPHQRKLWLDPALEHAQNGRSFAIEGGPGLGKRALADRAIQERYGTGATVVLKAQELRPESVPQARAQRPATWVLISADRFPRASQIEIAHAIMRTPGSMAIATLEQPLDRAVADGLVAPTFASLFAGRRISMPPLNERREDIAAIVRLVASRLGIAPERISVPLIEQIARAGWPGGIGEIETVLREAAASSEGPLQIQDRPLTRPPSAPQSPPAADDPSLARARLLDALNKAGGSIASAARSLGMSRQAVYREAYRLGLDVGKRKAR